MVTTLMLSVCVPITVISFFGFRIYQHLSSMILSSLARQIPFGVATAYFAGTINLVKILDCQLRDKLTQAFYNVYVYGLYALRNSVTRVYYSDHIIFCNHAQVIFTK